MNELREKEYYKEKIAEMVEKIENLVDLEILYGIARAANSTTEKSEAEAK